MRSITLSQAVNEAIAEEMRLDSSVFLIGEDVAEAVCAESSSAKMRRFRGPRQYAQRAVLLR